MKDEELFFKAEGLDGPARDAFLEEACEGDRAKKERVETLLRIHEDGKGVLDDPPENVQSSAAIAFQEIDAERTPPDDSIRRDESQPEKDSLERGDKVIYFGDYVLEGEIARGAMGVVYRATQSNLKRTVALKTIRSTLLTTEEDIARFRGEAEAAASLDHPNIVPIYEVGEHDEQLYFTMKLIEGGTLRDKLEQLRSQPKKAARIMATVSTAVHSAHQRGILHRDLKPGNILIDQSGTPHITDFGLAKQLDSGTSSTLSGQILGTPNYMAPEQAAGGTKDVTTAADIYSLGALLYELLTGRPPHAGDSIMDTLRSALETEPPSPRSLDETIDRDLETISLKCLEKEPSNRYSSAAEVSDELERWLKDKPIEARRVSSLERAAKWVKRKPVFAGLAATAALFLLTLAIGGPLVGFRENRLRTAAEEAEKKHLVQVALSLETATPSTVPFLVDILRRNNSEELEQLLQDRLTASKDPRTQSRLAVALSVKGGLRWDILSDSIGSLAASEGQNLALAFQSSPSQSIAFLQQKYDSSETLEERNRIASLLLSLGESIPAQSQLALGEDLESRVAFIHEFGEWHGDLSPVLRILDSTDNKDLRSGLCLSLGELDPDQIDSTTRSDILRSLELAFLKAPDAGTHSAAEWAIRRWNGDVPSLAPQDRLPKDQEWFTNTVGMTMVKIAPGVFFPKDFARIDEVDQPFPEQAIAITEPFLMSWTPLDEALYTRVVKMARKVGFDPPGWNPFVYREDHRPVASVSWINALIFCNALSTIEGLETAYELNIQKNGVTIRSGADGYRIAYEAEWEHAFRAGTVTRFLTGETAERLQDYGNIQVVNFSVSRESRPNPWGLFDMLGNTWELTLDSGYPYPPLPGLLVNPVGSIGQQYSVRGGACNSGLFFYHGSSKVIQKIEKDKFQSFRVVRGLPGDSSIELSSNEFKSLLATGDRPLTAIESIHWTERLVHEGKTEEAEMEWNRLMDSHPENRQIPVLAAESFARHKDWKTARRFYLRDAEISFGSPILEIQVAATLATAGDKRNYEKLREKIAGRSYESLSIEDLNYLVTAGLLLPPYKGWRERLPIRQLADQMESGRSMTSPDARGAPIALALAALRFGDPEGAIGYLERLGKEPLQWKDRNSLCMCIRALALVRLGDLNAARTWAEAIETSVDTGLGLERHLRWHNWLIADLLRHELRAALHSD